jgi:hypothetical protein
MRFLSLGISLILLFSCCGNDPKTKQGIVDSVNNSSVSKLDTAHVFVLAAPLQIATLIKQSCPDPEMSLLCSDSSSAAGYVTDYKRGLNLGICITDIGYCALYGQQQDALHYLKKAETLIQELHLDNLGNPLVSRLKKNITQQDSMSKILLTLANLAQKQLNESGNEKTAFYISSGSFIEGMAISSGNKQFRNSVSFSGILAQEKLWLKNFMDALVFLKPDNDTQDLYNTFFTLQHYFDPIKVESKSGVPSSTYSKTDLESLRMKTVQLRNEAAKS